LNIDIGDKAVDKAVKRCKQQISKRPKNAGYHVLLGRLYLLKKDDEMARRSYETALDLDPNHQEALLSLAHLEQSSGSLDEALAKYEKMREKNPDHLGVAMLIAALLEKKGEYQKAKALYEEVLEKDPDSTAAANNLAFYYAAHEPTTENLARAQALIEPLIQKHKDLPHIVDTAAWVYYRQGKYEKARDLLMQVEEKVSDIPSINYHLGMIYLQLGDKRKAEKHLRLALQSEEPFPEKEDAKDTLQSLKE
jgi:tetratricopeptide (TPR) repeat protein